MNCTDFKIWIDKVKLSELKKPEVPYRDHISTCENCRKEYVTMLRIFNIIHLQKEQSVDSEQTQRIIGNLTRQKLIIRPYLRFNKIAAIAIIVAGLATGILAGNMLSQLNKTTSENPWNNEFSMLSDNSEYESYLFD